MDERYSHIIYFNLYDTIAMSNAFHPSIILRFNYASFGINFIQPIVLKNLFFYIVDQIIVTWSLSHTYTAKNLASYPAISIPWIFLPRLSIIRIVIKFRETARASFFFFFFVCDVGLCNREPLSSWSRMISDEEFFPSRSYDLAPRKAASAHNFISANRRNESSFHGQRARSWPWSPEDHVKQWII